MAVLVGVSFVGALAFSAFLSHSRRVAHAASAPTEVRFLLTFPQQLCLSVIISRKPHSAP
jgi:hypothetical protein